MGKQKENGKIKFSFIKSRKFKWLIGVPLGLIVIHAAAGFLLLPYLIKQQLINQFDKQFGRQLTIENVRVNPYALTLTITNFSLNDPDGKQFLSFDEFYGNYELFTFIKRIWSFKQIRLKRPAFNIRINKAGEVNFADLLPRAEKPKSQDEIGDPVRLSFDRIAIEMGRLSFADQKRPNEFFQRILDPINFELTDLSTLPDKQAVYSLQARTAHDESIQWTGNITVNPLWSEGHLKITGVKKPKLWAYLRELLDIEITSAGLDLELSYRMDGRTQPLQLALDDVTYVVKDFMLRPVEGDDELLGLNQFKIVGGHMRWPENKVEIESVHLSGIQGKAWLNEQGVLNWQELFANESKEQQEPPEESKQAEPSWQVLVKTIGIEDSALQFEDRGPKQPVVVDVSALILELNNLSSSPESEFDYKLNFNLNEQGTVTASGKIRPFQRKVSSVIEVSQASLLPFQPYVSEVANLELKSGQLGFKGNLFFHEEGAPRVRVTGTGNISEFASEDTLVKERFVAWKTLATKGLVFELMPNRFEIDEISWSEPYGKILIAEDQSVNLADVLAPINKIGPNSTDQQEPVAESEADASTPTEPFPVKIKTISVENASANFADYSLPLQFATKIHSLKGNLQNLSSIGTESASLTLEGTVDEYGVAKVNGELNPFQPHEKTKIDVDFENIELTNMTPYSAKFAGYKIDEGKLSLQLKYEVEDRKLRGENQIMMNQFTLGERIESPDAVDLPIGLAIALLKDTQGRIDIDLPVSGDMNDPKFSYGRIVGKAIINLITKIVTSPFNLLGSLVGVAGEDFAFVAYQPGSQDIPPSESQKLIKLADALKQRPSLRMEIRGSYISEIDADAIKQQRFEQQLTKRGKAIEPKSAKSKSAKTDSAVITQAALKQWYLELFSNQSLETLKAKHTVSKPRKPDVKTQNSSGASKKAAQVKTQLDTAGFYKSIRTKLIQAQKVTESELRQLDKVRAENIKAYPVTKGGVDAQRIFLYSSQKQRIKPQKRR